MNKLIISVMVCCLSIAAWASEQVDRTVDVDEDAFIKIEHVNGEATIKGWDKNQVLVRGTLSKHTDRFIFKHDNDEVLIEVKVKAKSLRRWNKWEENAGDKLEIFVPYQSRIKYNSMNADVDVESISGGVSIETINGNMEVAKLAGRIHLQSVNGDVTAKELAGDVNVETVNGDIYSTNSDGREDRYDSVNGDIEVKSSSHEINVGTVNGDIKLDLGEISQLNVSTVNGDIDASLSLKKNGDIDAYSVGGGINLNFQKEVSARFDIQAHAGGSISNLLSDDKMQKAKYGPSRWLEFSVNGGHGAVDISTVSGRVKLSTK